MSESSEYKVTLSNGAEINVISSSWMRAGAEAVGQWKRENPNSERVPGVSDIQPVGYAHDMVTVGKAAQ